MATTTTSTTFFHQATDLGGNLIYPGGAGINLIDPEQEDWIVGGLSTYNYEYESITTLLFTVLNRRATKGYSCPIEFLVDTSTNSFPFQTVFVTASGGNSFIQVESDIIGRWFPYNVDEETVESSTVLYGENTERNGGISFGQVDAERQGSLWAAFVPASGTAITRPFDKGRVYPVRDYTHEIYSFYMDNAPEGPAFNYVMQDHVSIITEGYQHPSGFLLETILNNEIIDFDYHLEGIDRTTELNPPDNTADTINFVDIYPPTIEDTVPGSGTTFADHRSNIELTVHDVVSGISLGTLYVYIDRGSGFEPLVEGGAPNLSISGTVTVTPSGSRAYRIIFDPADDTNYDQVVTVTGIVNDEAEPVEHTRVFEYDFRTWGVNDIQSTVTASPDATPPTISNVYPAVGSSNISAATTVRFDISDAETGVDIDSLYLSVAGEDVLVSGVGIASSGTAIVTGDRFSYHVEYDADRAYGYNSVIPVSISGSDLYIFGANSTTLDYTFQIVPDDVIQIGNIFIDVGDSVVATGTVTIYCDVTDTTYGIDYANTYFVINGDKIITTLTPLISGSKTYGYTLSYELDEPYYDGTLCIEIHAQNNYPSLL